MNASSLRRIGTKKSSENQKKTLTLNNIIKIAHGLVNPDTSTLAGLETYVKTWYVVKFNTHYKDKYLNEHTLSELLTLFYVYKISEDPEWYDNHMGNEDEDYENWVKEMMGDDYQSEEEMIADMVKYEDEEKKITESLPDSISTDFTDPELLKE